jgi:phage pi2 protein 07
MTNFNQNISKEENLYNELVNAFDINNLENYCNSFRDLINTDMKHTAAINDIKNILSLRKDQLLSNALEKNEIKTNAQAMVYYNDIKANKWNISQPTYTKLINLISYFKKEE